MRVISVDVECPWCGAEPGQPCTEGLSAPPFVTTLAHDHGHLARTIEVHPLQYGFKRGRIVLDPDPADPEVTERYARCPTCQQWSPCDVRKAAEKAGGG